MQPDSRYALFETEYGVCGIAWIGRGVSGLNFPEASPGATEARLQRIAKPAGPEGLPRAIGEAIALLQRYFVGEPVELSAVAVDLTGVSDFHREVYEAARRIGWGATVTYGELARQAGSPGAARAVGHALSRNPVAVIVPCHRVLASGNKIGGFSAYGGTSSKERLLAMEGVTPGVATRLQEPSLFDFL